jgi:hypothetical protein
MEITVICDNPQCEHYEEERSATLEPLGEDIYVALNSLICACGTNLRAAVGSPEVPGSMAAPDAVPAESHPETPADNS